jgi:hypothetical protein
MNAKLVRDREAHARLRRNLEAAYRQMRDDWHCGNPPKPLAVIK